MYMDLASNFTLNSQKMITPKEISYIPQTINSISNADHQAIK